MKIRNIELEKLLDILGDLIGQELLTVYETNNIKVMINDIKKNSNMIKQDIYNMQILDIANNLPSSDVIKHLENNFKNNIQHLKSIKKLINTAKKYSQETNYSFQNHSLIPALNVLNEFFSKKTITEGKSKWNIEEMIYKIKQDSSNLQKIYYHSCKFNLENNQEILCTLSSLRLYIRSTINEIYQIQEVLEAPPRTKKSKKSK